MEKVILLMVVEVSKDKRIRCDYESCNHGVYKRIHVVYFEDGHYECLGSSCYKKLTEQSNVTFQQASSVDAIGEGKVLTDQEREQLIENKALLLESLTYSPPDAPEAAVVTVTQVNNEQNYLLLKKYKKFNPEINYSLFPEGEKYSRALDMVNRRYRDLDMIINDRSYSYQNEIKALIDDMADTFQKIEIFEKNNKEMNLNQAVQYVEENKVTLDSKNVFVIGVDYQKGYFEIFDLVFSDNPDYSKFILGLEGGKIPDYMGEGVEDSYHGETYEELLSNIGTNVSPSVKFRIYNSNDYVGFVAAYALKKLFPSLPNPDDANDSLDFKNKAIDLIKKINKPSYLNN